MFLISHRGNINGKILEKENHPSYIDNAINLGFDVEIDLWIINNNWYLGHDNPQYDITKEWIIKNKNKIWCHAKNIDAFYNLIFLDTINSFYHQTDDVTLTTKKFLWTFPGKRPLTKISIAVLPENTDWTLNELNNCAGICSDYIHNYKGV